MISVSSPRIFLSLGSNLGDRRANLQRALEKLREKEVTIVGRSTFYQTEPLDLLEQPHFLNLVCEVQTTLQPERLLELCLQVETELGRRRELPRGPRTIDIDLLFYGNEVLQTSRLTLPHPRLYQRNFVLVPLQEMAPDFRDPASGKTVRQLRQECPDRSTVEPEGD